MKSGEKKLLALFRQLAPGQQDELLSFARLLAGKRPSVERVTIARPAGESVTAAIRRLVRSYPMLERRKLMGEASRLMTQHAIDGRSATEVIDDLEKFFARHYEQHRPRVESRKTRG